MTILIVFLYYTSTVCFALVHFIPHSIVISPNLNPCDRVFIHMHIYINMYAYMCSSLELFSKAPSCNVCFMKLSCMQTPPLTYYRTHFSYIIII